MNWSCLTSSAPQKTAKSTDSRFLDLGFESLESRQMMAGNVNVVVTNNNVVRITGDGQDNEVNVQALTTFSNLPTTGIKIEGQGGTTAGPAIIPTTTEHPLGGVRVSLRGGDDRFEFSTHKVPISGAVLVNSGAGNDLVGIRGGSVTAPTRIIAGAGNDVILVANIYGADLRIIAGGGNDHVSVGAESQPMYVPAYRNTEVRLGAGDDTLLLRNQYFVDLFVLAGGGHDVVAIQTHVDDVDMRLGGGIDAVYVHADSELVNDGRIAGGGGSDVFKFDPGATIAPVPTQFEMEETTDANILVNLTGIRFRARYLALGGNGDVLV